MRPTAGVDIYTNGVVKREARVAGLHQETVTLAPVSTVKLTVFLSFVSSRMRPRIVYNDSFFHAPPLSPPAFLRPLTNVCKVVDFGLALDANARQWDECRMGTSMYMAPELAKHRVQVCA